MQRNASSRIRPALSITALTLITIAALTRPASGEPAADILAVLPGGVGKDDVANLLPVDTLGVSLTLAELVPYPVANKEPGRRRALVRIKPL